MNIINTLALAAGGDLPPAGEAAVQQRLRAAGLRPTLGRIAILQILAATHPGWVDAETVIRELYARGMQLSQGTVYRTLKELLAHDMLVHELRSSHSGGKVFYGFRPPGGADDGSRIVCQQCGGTVAIGERSLQDQLRQLARRQGLGLSTQPLTVLGTCLRCASGQGETGRD
jgi:Fur family ferric uptake transcriptional regulator